MHNFGARRFCKSSAPSAISKHMALLIGINYTSSESAVENEHGYRPLTGPVNDAKEVKDALIGEVQTAALLPTHSTRILSDIFNYKKEDICLMTDEEVNLNTELWPSKANIVSSCLTTVHSLPMLNYDLIR